MRPPARAPRTGTSEDGTLSDPAKLQWRAIRQAVFRRDGGQCMRCKERCRSEDADVHHLIPRALGGSDDPGNLVTLCDGCHAAHHPTLQASLARRMIERWSLKLARWLDGHRAVTARAEMLGTAMRLLGKPGFRPGQLDAVMAALDGRSLLMVSPTGSGKSLCYQLPALLQSQVTVVLSPLKALMADQVSALLFQKVPATFINSSLTVHEKKLRLDLLDLGAIKLLYCAPERFDPALVGPNNAARMTALRPAFLVVDEAHCVDRWGDSFRPSYGRIAEVRRALGSPPVLAFTATAGIETQRRILESLGVPDATVFVTDVDRPNIALYRCLDVEAARKAGLIAELLSISHGGRTMIFVPTVREGEQVRTRLAARGVHVPFYHARLDEVQKSFLQGRFSGQLQPSLDAIICTNAFGMGLDIADVRLVVHWRSPGSVEDYVQEFGRAGRDGRQSVAVLFASAEDARLQKFMLEKTVEGLRRSSDAAMRDPARLDAIVETRSRQIAQMIALAGNRKACFRQQVQGYFVAPSAMPRARIPLSHRLIAWLFGSRGRRLDAAGCCDVCDAVQVISLEQHCRALLAPETSSVSTGPIARMARRAGAQRAARRSRMRFVFDRLVS